MPKAVLFQAILFSKSTKFISILKNSSTVDLGAMAMKGRFAFPKAPALVEPYCQIV